MKNFWITALIIGLTINSFAQQNEFIKYPQLSKYNLKKEAPKQPDYALIGKTNFYAKDYKQARYFLGKVGGRSNKLERMRDMATYKLNQTLISFSKDWHILGSRYSDVYQWGAEGYGNYRKIGDIWLTGGVWDFRIRHGIIPIYTRYEYRPLFELELAYNAVKNSYFENVLKYKDEFDSYNKIEDGANENITNKLSLNSFEFGIWIARVFKVYRANQNVRYVMNMSTSDVTFYEVDNDLSLWGLALGSYKNKDEPYVELDWSFKLNDEEEVDDPDIDHPLFEFTRLKFLVHYPVMRNLEFRGTLDWTIYNNVAHPNFLYTGQSGTDWKKIQTLGLWLGVGIRI